MATLESVKELVANVAFVEKRLKTEVSELTAKAEEVQKEIEVLEGALAIFEMCVRKKLQAAKGVTSVARTLLKTVHGPQFDFALAEVMEEDESGFQMLKGVKLMCSEFGVTMPPSRLGTGGETIVHIAIRLAMLLLNPDARKILMLDEPAPTVDSERWGTFLHTISSIIEKAGGQLIFITHTGHVEPVTYYVSKPTNASYIKREEVAWKAATKGRKDGSIRKGSKAKRKKSRA